MKAVRYRSCGDSDVLVYEDADRPVAGPGQVVVKVAGVDAGDLKIYVTQRRPLADLAAVHHEADTGRLSGKTILTP
jgi:NADPH:quinone reductase-like Zn-dependent oxidoreductase